MESPNDSPVTLTFPAGTRNVALARTLAVAGRPPKPRTHPNAAERFSCAAVSQATSERRPVPPPSLLPPAPPAQ